MPIVHVPLMGNICLRSPPNSPLLGLAQVLYILQREAGWRQVFTWGTWNHAFQNWKLCPAFPFEAPFPNEAANPCKQPILFFRWSPSKVSRLWPVSWPRVQQAPQLSLGHCYIATSKCKSHPNSHTLTMWTDLDFDPRNTQNHTTLNSKWLKRMGCVVAEIPKKLSNARAYLVASLFAPGPFLGLILCLSLCRTTGALLGFRSGLWSRSLLPECCCKDPFWTGMQNWYQWSGR